MSASVPYNLSIPAELVDVIAIDEAADYIGSTRKRIYDLRSAGRLSRTGDGSRVLVDRQELDDLIGGVQ